MLKVMMQKKTSTSILLLCSLDFITYHIL